MMQEQITRRRFVGATTAGVTATLALPTIVTAEKNDKEIVVGEGDYRYRVEHNWPQLPDKYSWQTTHNVAFDKSGNLYVIHEGNKRKKDHPSIFVFDADGKFVRAFGEQFQGGGHGIEVREEGGEEFLYVAAYLDLKTFAKLNLKGETVWQNYAPVECGAYAKGEEKPSPGWGRKRFLPTNFAFLDDGDFFLVDGYGSYLIHRYDKDGKYKSSFGGVGKGEGKFNLPHGLWVDNRGGREPQVVVTDRAHHKVQYLTLDGKHIKTQSGFGLPANVDTYKNLMVIPELHARVTLLDENNKVVARLGADVQRVTKGKNIRGSSSKWLDGKFVHPHDACFDAHGNIFVAEWVAGGRVTKLARVS
ncbi:MAG: peptidase [Pirellulales bacterium]|nr:peptidase [Pirellulales bacterium]